MKKLLTTVSATACMGGFFIMLGYAGGLERGTASFSQAMLGGAIGACIMMMGVLMCNYLQKADENEFYQKELEDQFDEKD